MTSFVAHVFAVKLKDCTNTYAPVVELDKQLELPGVRAADPTREPLAPSVVVIQGKGKFTDTAICNEDYVQADKDWEGNVRTLA
jgi:hypothetical protein